MSKGGGCMTVVVIRLMTEQIKKFQGQIYSQFMQKNVKEYKDSY